MKAEIQLKNTTYSVDFDNGTDISIPLVPGKMTPNCFYAPFFDAKPFTSGDFTGSVKKGAPVNFFNVFINPHGNGTHTDCVGHIIEEPVTINKSLTQFLFFGEVISVFPQLLPDGDKVITRENLEMMGRKYETEVLILRTLPNDDGKREKNYSGTNPPYVDKGAVELINEWNIKHLVLDLPSVDKEEDGGKLLGHKTFWATETGWDFSKTITELVYIPEKLKDGLYFVQFSIISLEIDVSPSKLILYPVE
ncbi:MAG: cyclase family protein [Saprospiraceae bacterium]|nr:cyclase family protein [Saprospiraceae bacterium]